MKRNLFKKYKLYVIIVFLVLVLSISSIALTFAITTSNTDQVKFEVSTLSEEDAIYRLLNYAANDKNEEKTITFELPELEIKPPKIVIAKADEKEDPNKLKLENRGVAKESNASDAVAKYETNETSLGIDVSTYQNKIDWKQVKEAGISFAMIRVGFRGYGTGKILMDKYFYDNVKGAIANNINVGVYFFSAAVNELEAQEEAAWTLNAIKGYDITYPIAIDIEIFGNRSDTRLYGVSDHQMTSNALAFVNYVKNHGYTPMIYSYMNALTNRFEVGRFGSTRIWLAQYNDKVTYKGNYHMWQYTSEGSVPGIEGRVDMNVAYFSVTNDISKQQSISGANGGVLDNNVVFTDVEFASLALNDVTLRASPSVSVPNKVGDIPAGTAFTITGISSDFVRIKYNGSIYYINGIDQVRLPDVNFMTSNSTIYLEKEVTTLLRPYKYLSNNDGVTLPVDTEVLMTGVNSDFIRIVYNGDTFYINDTRCFRYNKDKEEEETPPEETPPPDDQNLPENTN